jgi:chromosome segregation ATPase
MKTKAILAFVVAGALGFTSCSKKIDEKTMGEINQFGTDWTALGEKATAWSNQLTETTNMAKEFTAKQTEMVSKMATSKDEAMKTKMNDMVTACTNNVGKLEAMGTEWNTFKATWDETTKQFTDWKDKVSKGEVSAEEAVKGLADFKTKMNDAQTKVEGWNTAYAEVKTSYDNSVASADEMAKSMETATPVKKNVKK